MNSANTESFFLIKEEGQGRAFSIIFASVFSVISEKGSILQSARNLISSNSQDSTPTDAVGSNIQSENSSGWKLIEQKFCGGMENNGDYIFRSVLQKV